MIAELGVLVEPVESAEHPECPIAVLQGHQQRGLGTRDAELLVVHAEPHRDVGDPLGPLAAEHRPCHRLGRGQRGAQRVRVELTRSGGGHELVVLLHE